jgi:hypothetical protein
MQWINSSSNGLYGQQRQCLLLGIPVQYIVSFPPSPTRISHMPPFTQNIPNYFTPLYQLPFSQLIILFTHKNCLDFFFHIVRYSFFLQPATFLVGLPTLHHQYKFQETHYEKLLIIFLYEL